MGPWGWWGQRLPQILFGVTAMGMYFRYVCVCVFRTTFMMSCFWNDAFQSSAYLLCVLLCTSSNAVFATICPPRRGDTWLHVRCFLVADVQKKCLHSLIFICFAVCCYVFHLLCFCSGQFAVMRVICLFGMFVGCFLFCYGPHF